MSGDARAQSAARWIVLALVVATVLRTIEAVRSSYWLDELHSIAHASPPDLAGVAEHTHWDFHPPLFFMTLHAFGSWNLGHWLRAIPIAASLLTFLPVYRLARRSRGGRRAGLIALAFLATLPYQVHFGCELRPYSFLALASATAAWAAFTDDGSRWLRFSVFALATAFGLESQYLMALVVVAIGLVRIVMAARAWWRPHPDAPRFSPLPLPGLVLAGTIGACGFLPWLLAENGASWMTNRAHEFVPPAKPSESPSAFTRYQLLASAQSVVRVAVPSVRSLGSPWSEAALAAGAVLALALIGAGWARFGRRAHVPGPRRPAADPGLQGLALYAAAMIMLMPFLSLLLWQRVGLQYFSICAWAVPAGLGALLSHPASGPMRRMVALALAAAATLGIAQAFGGGREDIRGAVATAVDVGAALERAGEKPVYTALLEQPPLNKKGIFEHRIVYLAYAPAVRSVEPDEVPAPGSPEFARPLVVVTRNLALLNEPPRLPQALNIRNGRRVRNRIPVDPAGTMVVWVLGV